VDIWSIGIIMYIILVGKHPLFVKGESFESYATKLKDPKWEFPPGFSPLARSLFLSMVKTNALERYTAKDALSHPWITRRPGDIPRSYVETISFERAKDKLHLVWSI
jgi:calcium/calmodulin-dependent protein kinase I